MESKQLLGAWGEVQAVDHLRKKGYAILACNYRCRLGEIDIIARRRGIIAFVEVKRRSSTAYGQPAEAVNLQKQARIAQAAALYMQENELDDANIRFDIIEILPGEIRHIEGAFDATNQF